jgi:hypothetical protein
MRSKTTLIIASAAALVLALSVYVVPMQNAKALITARTLIFPIELKNGHIGKSYQVHIQVHDNVDRGANANYVITVTATSLDMKFRAVEQAPIIFVPGTALLIAVTALDYDASGIGADEDCDCAGAFTNVVSFNPLALTYTYSNALLTPN